MATYKTISNTFTVTTVEDGVSVPSYIQSQEAWSNQATSSSDATMPSDCVESDWQDNTPQRNGKSYLWRRSRQMQLNSNNEYEVVGAAPGWKYQRLSGTNGTSISPKGTVVSVASSSSGLPSSGVTANDLAIVPSSAKLYKYSNGWSQVSTASSDGDCYVVENDCTYGGENVKGHMFMFSTETGRWIDLGQFKGENGATYYTHIAWASDVTIVNNVVTGVSGFSVGIGANGEAKPWMGICIDQNSADPQTYTSYTWKYLKGEQGAVLSIDNTMDSMQYRNTYSGRTKITARVYTTATLYDKGVVVPADAVTWNATFVGCSGGVGHKTQGGGFVQDGTIEATENPKCFYVDNMTQERGSVTITATYKGTVYTIIFTVVRLIDAKKYQLEVSPTGISYNRNESPSETVGVYMKVVEYSPDGSVEYLETLGNSLEFVVTAKDSLGDNENYIYPSNKIYYNSQRSAWYFWTDCELYDSYTIELLYGGETVDIQDVIVSRYENGAAGQNSIRLDLDNEMDALQYVGDEPIPNAAALTNAYLYNGATLVNAASITKWECVANNCEGYAVNGNNTNPKAFEVDELYAMSGSLTIKATYKGNVYSAVFSVDKLVNQDKYYLEILPNAIPYNTDNGIVNPNVKIYVWKSPYDGSAPVAISNLSNEGISLVCLPYAGATSGQAGTAVSLVQHTPSGGTPYWDFNANCASYSNYVVTLYKGTSSQGKVLDRETIPVAKVSNGLNSIHLDLDNDMDSIQYVGTTARNTATTRVMLYDGESPVPLSNSQLTWPTAQQLQNAASNCTVAYGTDGTNYKTIIVSAITNNADKGTATINVTYKGQSYSIVFTVVKLQDVPKYDLEITPNALTYNSTTNTLSSQSLSIKIRKRDVNAALPTYLTNLESGMELDITSASGSDYSASHTSGSQTWTFSNIDSEEDYYRVTLSQGSGSTYELLDQETIPIAKVANGADGADGIGSLVADLSNEMDAVPMTYEGAVIGSGTPKQVALSTTVTLFYGTDSQTITSMSAGQYSSGTGNIRVSFPKISGTNNYTGVANIYVTHNTTMTDDKVVIPITAVCALGSRTVEFTIQGVRAGAEGESPTIYQISLSSNEIKVTSDGQRSISQIRAQIYKTTGNEPPVAANTEKYLCYSIDSGTATQVPSNGVVPVDSVTTNITFRLYEDNTKTLLLDTETIPVVKDGDDSYWFDMQSATARVNQDGIMVVNLSWHVMRGGQIIAPTTDKCYTKLSGSSSWTAATKGLNTTANMWFNAADIGGHPYDSTNDGIDIKYVDANNLTRVTKRISFTKDGENSTMYEIRPSIGDSISIASNETNMTIATITVTFHKKDGDGAWQSISGYAAMYTKRVTTSGVEYGTAPHTRMTSSASSWTITGLNVHYSNTAYVIVFRTDSVYGASEAWSEDYIAKKEILITKQGNSPISYEIVVTSSEARIEPTGVMYGHVYWKLYSVQGTTRTELKNINATSGHAMQRKLNTANSWAAATWNSTSNIYTDGGLYNNIDWKSIRSTLSAIPSSVELRYVLNGIVVASTEVEFSIQGQMGKNYYYAGVWNSVKHYTVTTYTTPFVQYGTETSASGKPIKRYYVLIAEDGYTSTNETPGNTGHWVRMTNSFDYLISNAVFTDFAQLGASVFNGDYMFSQHGYAIGFDGLKQRIQDDSMFQNVNPNNMDGTISTDDGNWLWLDTPEQDIDSEVWDDMEGPTNLVEGWYSFVIEGRSAGADATLLWKIATSANANPIVSGEIGYSGASQTERQAVMFQCIDEDPYYLFLADSTGGDGAFLRQYCLHPCGFAPTYYLNLRTGKLVANDVTARGAIYATEGVFRGTVYAENGEFNGRVVATSGEFRNITTPNGTFNIDENGYLECSDAKVKGSIYNPLLVINDSNMLMYVLPHWNSSSVIDYYNILLDLTGLNVMIDWNWPTGAYIQLPCTDSKYNGAKAHIYNGTSKNVSIHGALTNIANNYSLTTGQIGIFYCVPNGTNFVWIKIN